jgi:5'-3' exonuclease
MGIPSYFRRILQKYPGCLQKSVAPGKTSTLYFDFNCLIYRCLRAETLPEWTEETNAEWEASLLREVVKVVKEVVSEAGNPKNVYLAVDGVVPMAKIRQQRVRRFKSVWLKELEGKAKGWDSNSITPGTEFMDKLTTALEGNGWVVSGVREKGEGEHKIMNWLRESKEKSDVIIYGLDADLILLSILNGELLGRKMWLMREQQEFGGGGLKQDADGKHIYVFMNLNEFKQRLNIKGYLQALNYVALMSLMGNDFLPHSITHKLNDDGHEYVVNEYTKMLRGQSKWLVNDKGVLDVNVLRAICAEWARDETDKMFLMIRKKREQSGRGVLKGMNESEGMPLGWAVEKLLIDEESQLVNNWREVYRREWIRFESKDICREYTYGCQWVLDYYTGKPINKGWMFPSWVPPLWSELVKHAELVGKDLNTETEPEPEEQLAMVLPLESWGLIRDKKLRILPRILPQMWPASFSFFSAGRKWLWECEAMVPSLTAGRLRSSLKEMV